MLCVAIGIVGAVWFISSCVTIGTSLGSTLGGLLGFLFCACTLGSGVWCCYCLLGYKFVTGAFTRYGLAATYCLYWRCPLYLLIDFCSAYFGVMLNNSAWLLNTALWVSFIVANGAFGVGFCNASTKSHAANIAASIDDTLGILTFLEGNYTASEIIPDIFLLQIICNTYSVPNLVQYTIPLIHACSV